MAERKVSIQIENQTSETILGYFVLHMDDHGNKNLFMSEALLKNKGIVKEGHKLTHNTTAEDGIKGDSFWLVMWVESDGDIHVTEHAPTGFGTIKSLLEKQFDKLHHLKVAKSTEQPAITDATIVLTALATHSLTLIGTPTSRNMNKYNLNDTDDRDEVVNIVLRKDMVEIKNSHATSDNQIKVKDLSSN